MKACVILSLIFLMFNRCRPVEHQDYIYGMENPYWCENVEVDHERGKVRYTLENPTVINDGYGLETTLKFKNNESNYLTNYQLVDGLKTGKHEIEIDFKAFENGVNVEGSGYAALDTFNVYVVQISLSNDQFAYRHRLDTNFRNRYLFSYQTGLEGPNPQFPKAYDSLYTNIKLLKDSSRMMKTVGHVRGF